MLFIENGINKEEKSVTQFQPNRREGEGDVIV